MEPDPVFVRATCHLPDGITPGRFYWVDRSERWIRDAISGGCLEVVDERADADAA